MRYLGIDLGAKRTGLAVGDDESGLVGPVGVLETPLVQASGNALINEIEGAIREHLARHDEVVFGLPMNMDGSEGQASREVRAFAARVASRTARRVHLHDERLTTVEADWQMARTGLTRQQKKERRDALAAANMLRSFLEQRRQGPDGAAEEG